MVSETNDEIACHAAPPSEPSAAAAAELWYCSHCTNLILPPGEPGIVGDDGERFCQSCSPYEVKSPPTVMANATPPIRSGRQRLKSDSGTNLKRGPAPHSRLIWIVGSAAAFMVAATSAILISSRATKMPAPQSATADPYVMKTIVLGASDNSKPTTSALEATKKTEAAEKPAHAEIQTQGGGLFASMQPGVIGAADATPRSPDNKAKGGEVKAVASPELKIGDFDSRLKALDGLLDAERYSEANALLSGLAKDFDKAPWWKERAESYANASATYKERCDTFEQESRDALSQAKSVEQIDMLDKLEKEWKSRLALGEATAKPAQRILDAVIAGRERIAKASFEKRSGLVAEQFEKYEKRVKTKLPRTELDEALKALQELKAQMLDNAELGQRFCDRWAALQFDLNLSQSAERSAFHVDPSGSDPAEVFYDFKDADQFKAWKFEGDGSNSGGAEFDAAAKTVLLKANGEHHLDPKGGKRAPSLTLPFYFTPANWTFEADTALLKVHARDKRDQLPCYGILVSDGGANAIRLSIKESKKNELRLTARWAGDEKETVAHLPGKEEDKLHLRIACTGGRVYLSAYANSNGNAKALDVGRTAMGFEPKVFALYVETHDKDENATVEFDNVKLTGGIDKAKINAAMDARRSAEINAVKAEFCRTPKPAPAAPNVTPTAVPKK